MTRRAAPSHSFQGLVLVCLLLPQFAQAAESDAEFFEKRVRPLLVERCEACHSAARGTTRGGLALDTRPGWRLGGDRGTPIQPGKPQESLLIQAIQYGDDELRMPPAEKGGKLADAEIATLVEWVRRGAPDPRTGDDRIGGMTTDEARSWWSFQKLQPVAPPTVQDLAWPNNAIDRFILSELEQRGLSHAAPADRRAWIRRATFDVTGLPPTPDEVAAFVHDSSPEAPARVVDRLLASNAYGQRWARHWLDVARYADYHDANPQARTASCELTEAWRYRDWVVDSLNDDLPFDQFIRHQIAGDLMPSPLGDEVYPAGLIATTFLTNGVWDRGDADKEKIVSDMVDDNIDTIGKAFLGLTLGCARCHDHKFDPIPTSDYYALAGIFYSSHILSALGTKGGEYTLNRVPLVPAAQVAQRQAQVARIAAIEASLTKLDKQTPQPPDDDPQRMKLVAERTQLQTELLPATPLAMAIQEGGTAGGLFSQIQDVPIHIRGSYARPGPIVPRRLPQLFAGDQQVLISSGSGRHELAEWIAAGDNPLTARVIVNRIWQWHFGAGLVRTANNFGKLGESPSHPALLDWLAARLIDDGWSLKQLHRRIMLSATYQQSSRMAPADIARDVENRWLGRFAPRRLEAEAIRDSMLAVAGQLDSATGGPAGNDFTIARRSLYVQTARWNRSSYAMLFDAANPDASTEQRNISTVAPQALLLMNHPFVFAQAQRVAEQLVGDIPDDAARIDRVYRLLLGRPPTEEEVEIARDVVSAGGIANWADLAHVLLCSNEFVYLD